MEFAVLVKAVPLSEEIRYSVDRRAVVRDAGSLVLNAFDQRALRVALELRRGGESVTAVSLGPPNARSVLGEARALGADRAVHLCDPAFAGSDVLATSTALAATVRRLAPGLIVAGARSTDSDTGLVGPEVAARLGVPVVSFARAIRRGPGSKPLEIDVDTSRGWATVRATPPLVVTVGEKICKPLRVTSEQLHGVGLSSVETLGLSEVGVARDAVGAPGSPTRVEGIVEVAPTRGGRTFSAEDVRRRVTNAVAALRSLLQKPDPPLPPLPRQPYGRARGEVVAVVSGPQGTIDPDAVSLVTYLRRRLPRHSVSVAAYGPDPGATESRGLETAGACGGYLLEAAAPFDSADVAAGLASFWGTRPHVDAVVCPASPFGREVAGQLAAGRELGIVGDAIDAREGPDGRLLWSKPSFGGTTIATIGSRSGGTVVTMPTGLTAAATDAGSDRPFSWTRQVPPSPRARVQRLAEVVERPEGPEVNGADVVVGVGMGVGGPDQLARLLPAVRRWGAVVVGTRRVVDAGWLPARLQLGLTGRSLAPRLAILLGVRGAAYHMVGWARARTVLAVNSDPAAPVFRQADIGIVGSVEEVLPELAEPLALALGRPAGP